MTLEHSKYILDPQREGISQSLAEDLRAGGLTSWPPAQHRAVDEPPMYVVCNNCFWRQYKTKIAIISNFIAWIVAWDSNGYLVEGRLYNGEPLPSVRVGLLKQGWSCVAWGLRPLVTPGQHQALRRCVLLGLAGGIPLMSIYEPDVESDRSR